MSVKIREPCSCWVATPRRSPAKAEKEQDARSSAPGLPPLTGGPTREAAGRSVPVARPASAVLWPSCTMQSLQLLPLAREQGSGVITPLPTTGLLRTPSCLPPGSQLPPADPGGGDVARLNQPVLTRWVTEAFAATGASQRLAPPPKRTEEEGARWLRKGAPERRAFPPAEGVFGGGAGAPHGRGAHAGARLQLSGR